jgi:hypothetical protein
MQFLFDMKILRTHQKCSTCFTPLTLAECPTTKYRDQRAAIGSVSAEERLSLESEAFFIRAALHTENS